MLFFSSVLRRESSYWWFPPSYYAQSLFQTYFNAICSTTFPNYFKNLCRLLVAVSSLWGLARPQQPCALKCLGIFSRPAPPQVQTSHFSFSGRFLLFCLSVHWIFHYSGQHCIRHRSCGAFNSAASTIKFKSFFSSVNHATYVCFWWVYPRLFWIAIANSTCRLNPLHRK